jgi:hypothetical protein
MNHERLISELKQLVRDPADGHLYGGIKNNKYPSRWMPAVLVRKQTIRAILKELSECKK